jgi:hypothetical protein
VLFVQKEVYGGWLAKRCGHMTARRSGWTSDSGMWDSGYLWSDSLRSLGNSREARRSPRRTAVGTQGRTASWWGWVAEGKLGKRGPVAI